DDRYGEALAALDKVQELLQSGKYTGPDEGKNVALLRAAVLFFEGRDFDVARDALRKYLELNTDNPGRALCRLSFFMCTMEQALVDSQKALELTSMLMDEGYLTDKYISQDEFRKWELHGLLHHHQKAVAFAGKWDESTRLCIEIMEDYYPDTMAGANSALGLALYISWHDKDWDGAERLLNDVLENAPYDGIAPFVYAALAEIADARGDRAKALTLLEQSFDRIGTAPYGRGPVQHLRENSQRLRSKILGQ
ncbi:MAG TPA: hypothetical protein PLG59_01945, partial [bacterium]|nr:hypothetical protein [bacterium]